ncbi:MAG: type II toxin-antitoxin system HicA family toxin [Muribaculaceae bacterium]|nr:type II toxin-antitoxin system HicA family toxin [Muribaculaceae bacterium]
MKRLKVKDVLVLLKDDGWEELKPNGGDHRQFKHPDKKGRVTVNGKPSDTLDQFLLNSIFKQAGWR